jgi:site-specific recombinase
LPPRTAPSALRAPAPPRANCSTLWFAAAWTTPGSPILFRQNLTLLARKTVERTGHSGEHYVASNSEYWQMWRAAVGGGILTVITAALKLKIVGAHLPLFVRDFWSAPTMQSPL